MKGLLAALAGILIGMGAVYAADRTGVIELSSSDDTTTTTETTRTTDDDNSTTTTTKKSSIDPAVALWPPPGSDERFTSPEEAARSFASNFIGFADVTVGSFQAGDPSSGEVPVQPRANGPVTRVLVRQLEPGAWWATGAVNDQIRIDSPEPGGLAKSPLKVTGAAQAFEGNVQVEVRADNASKPVGTGFVTGAQDQMGQFEGIIRFDQAAATPADYGALLLIEQDANVGHVNKATVIRIRF